MNRQKTIHVTEPSTVPRGRAKKQCACGKWFVLPKCHADRHSSCSADCASTQRREKALSRQRQCQGCGGEFIPRIGQLKEGQGKFCSLRCSTKSYAATENWQNDRKKGAEKYKQHLREGVFSRLSGEQHPQWSGGPLAARKRRIKSGKSAEALRRYRKANPERLREWTQRRSAGYTTRLPRGTVSKLHVLQRGRCAYCTTKLPNDFHVDHIHPIAGGGKHVPENLQLLCPTCNVRKWMFDPIVYAQKIGKLL